MLRVVVTRGDRPESVHEVSIAVVDGGGRLVGAAGDPGLVTFWRSSAKPFQAIPVVASGAADRFGFGPPELALACASHSSEPAHVALAARMLTAIGATEADLACGPHPPLSEAVARDLARAGRDPTPVMSNCSGKHAAMLALCRAAEWPLSGYERGDHPAQRRILETIAAWTGVPADRIPAAVDGCQLPTYALPLEAMARAWARLATTTDAAASRVRDAMMAEPFLVAGTGRACTDLMAAWPGGLCAKIGAEGVYCAALPAAGLGLALKVASGDMRAAPVALVAVLRQLLDHPGAAAGPTGPAWGAAVAAHGSVPLYNTRGTLTGRVEAEGRLRVFGPLA